MKVIAKVWREWDTNMVYVSRPPGDKERGYLTAPFSVESGILRTLVSKLGYSKDRLVLKEEDKDSYGDTPNGSDYYTLYLK